MSEWQQGGQAGWPSNSGEPVVDVTAAPAVQLTEEEKDAHIQSWMNDKNALDAAKTAEAATREKVREVLFPTPKKGTQRYISPKGYGSIKLVYGWNYSLGDKDKIDPSTGLKLPIAKQVEDVLDQIEALGERGGLIVDRIVKWKPELVVSEYELLANSEHPDDIAAKTLIDGILTVSPASPQIAFEPPKAAK